MPTISNLCKLFNATGASFLKQGPWYPTPFLQKTHLLGFTAFTVFPVSLSYPFYSPSCLHISLAVPSVWCAFANTTLPTEMPHSPIRMMSTQVTLTPSLFSSACSLLLRLVFISFCPALRSAAYLFPLYVANSLLDGTTVSLEPLIQSLEGSM